VLQRSKKQKISDKRRRGNEIKGNLREERVMWRKRKGFYAKSFQLSELYCIPRYKTANT